MLVGAKSFDWPSWDDVDDVHISCVFYGPVRKKGLKKLKSKRSLIKMLHG